MSDRIVRHRHEDPLDRVWLETARRVGLLVRRCEEAYAATDGAGVLVLGSPETLDADDCIAQMVFHELCHSLVEGPSSFGREDWGLDNTSDRDLVREHACLRTQAVLAGRHGLRTVLAPTTDHRAFWDGLSADPLKPPADASVVAAKLAVRRAADEPWAPHLEEALAATGSIAREAARFGPPPQAAPPGLPSLWEAVEPPPDPHPTGLPGAAPAAGRTCGDCAWLFTGGRGRAVSRCRQAEGARVESGWQACERHEPALDCRSCGACCREGFDIVLVPPRDPFRRAHPELLERRGKFVEVRRTGPRCSALSGGDGEPYSCDVYGQRPRPCEELAVGGEHCLTARQRVGLSL